MHSLWVTLVGQAVASGVDMTWPTLLGGAAAGGVVAATVNLTLHWLGEKLDRRTWARKLRHEAYVDAINHMERRRNAFRAARHSDKSGEVLQPEWALENSPDLNLGPVLLFDDPPVTAAVMKWINRASDALINLARAVRAEEARFKAPNLEQIKPREQAAKDAWAEYDSAFLEMSNAQEAVIEAMRVNLKLDRKGMSRG